MHPKQNHLLITKGPCLVASPELIPALGRTPSTFLQQVHYWSVKESVGVIEDGVRWIYNTVEEWASQIKVSTRQMQRIISALRQKGLLLIKKLSRHRLFQKYGYAINYERLNELFPQAENTEKTDPSPSLENPPNTDKMALADGHNVVLYITETTQREKSLSPKKEASDKEKETESRETKKEGFPRNDPPLASPEELLDVWNTVLGKELGKGELTPKRAIRLKAAFTKKFGSSKDRWQRFCHALKASPFLMGKKTGFKASLDWVLKFDTLQRLLEGDLGVERLLGQKEVQPRNSVRENLLAADMPPEERAFRLTLCKALGEDIYQNWFAHAAVTLTVETVTLSVATPFLRDYVDTYFSLEVPKLTGKKLIVQITPETA